MSRPAVALVEIAGRLDDVALSRAIQAAIVRFRVTEAAVRVALGDRPASAGAGGSRLCSSVMIRAF